MPLGFSALLMALTLGDTDQSSGDVVADSEGQLSALRPRRDQQTVCTEEEVLQQIVTRVVEKYRRWCIGQSTVRTRHERRLSTTRRHPASCPDTALAGSIDLSLSVCTDIIRRQILTLVH